MDINIYNTNGDVIDNITLPSGLEYVSGRTSKVGEVYYKGVGCPYRQHSSIKPAIYENIISPSGVFYYGHDVQNPAWIGKSGIFQSRYQPYFSDFIGTCGPKESNIISNSEQFELSAVNVRDCIKYDMKHNQQFFVLTYVHNRDTYISEGEPGRLVNLLSYMLINDWNFTWDKCSIGDICTKGLVTDVADMFKSSELIHKIGTVYSILYSLHQASLRKYIDFSKYCHAVYSGVSGIPFFAIQIIKSMGIQVDEVARNGYDNTDAYINIIGNWLLPGKNCSSVEDSTFNSEVSKQYIDRFISSLPEHKRQIVGAYNG